MHNRQMKEPQAPIREKDPEDITMEAAKKSATGWLGIFAPSPAAINETFNKLLKARDEEIVRINRRYADALTIYNQELEAYEKQLNVRNQLMQQNQAISENFTPVAPRTQQEANPTTGGGGRSSTMAAGGGGRSSTMATSDARRTQENISKLKGMIQDQLTLLDDQYSIISGSFMGDNFGQFLSRRTDEKNARIIQALVWNKKDNKQLEESYNKLVSRINTLITTFDDIDKVLINVRSTAEDKLRKLVKNILTNATYNASVKGPLYFDIFYDILISELTAISGEKKYNDDTCGTLSAFYHQYFLRQLISLNYLKDQLKKTPDKVKSYVKFVMGTDRTELDIHDVDDDNQSTTSNASAAMSITSKAHNDTRGVSITEINRRQYLTGSSFLRQVRIIAEEESGNINDVISSTEFLNDDTLSEASSVHSTPDKVSLESSDEAAYGSFHEDEAHKNMVLNTASILSATSGEFTSNAATQPSDTSGNGNDKKTSFNSPSFLEKNGHA
jgi:hypothetical protein